MKIIQVLPRIATQSSGPTYSVTSLCKELVTTGNDVELHILEPNTFLGQPYPIISSPTARIPLAYRLGFSPTMKRRLIRAAADASIVHNHSMWMSPNIYASIAAEAHTECKFVYSLRGTVSSWALKRSRYLKKIVWQLGQREALLRADCLHATSMEEVSDIRRMGLRAPIAMVPNGISVPPDDTLVASREAIVLFLSRIHPTKGVENLLHAWSRLEQIFPAWRLHIAGPLEAPFPRAMVKLARNLGIKHVRFLGELRGAQKEQALASSRLFVLPTHSENFGIAIAEALAHATPVITTKEAPWAGLEDNKCGWWIDDQSDSLFDALKNGMQLPREELAAMGASGRNWMKRDFAWNDIGSRIHTTYLWLKGKAERPDWIF